MSDLRSPRSPAGVSRSPRDVSRSPRTVSAGVRGSAVMPNVRRRSADAARIRARMARRASADRTRSRLVNSRARQIMTSRIADASSASASPSAARGTTPSSTSASVTSAASTAGAASASGATAAAAAASSSASSSSSSSSSATGTGGASSKTLGADLPGAGARSSSGGRSWTRSPPSARSSGASSSGAGLSAEARRRGMDKRGISTPVISKMASPLVSRGSSKKSGGAGATSAAGGGGGSSTSSSGAATGSGASGKDSPPVKRIRTQKSFASLQKGALAEKYEILEKLGKGTFGVVRRVVSYKTGLNFAAKIISKRHLSKSEKLELLNEVGIMRKLRHENVVRMYDLFDTPRHMYIVMELLTGGELFDRIVAKHHFNEAEAAFITEQIALGLKYMHSNHIVHRDLKPENIVFAQSSKEDDSGSDLSTDEEDGGGSRKKSVDGGPPGSPDAAKLMRAKSQQFEADLIVKITDFGLAREFSRPTDGSTGSMTTTCGTPGYCAPEILKLQRYGECVDLWSMGVILYIMLCGFPPFPTGANVKIMYAKIKKGEYSFPDKGWANVSDLAKDCVRGLLTVNPTERMTAEDLLSHPWIKSSKKGGPQLNLMTDGFAKKLKIYSHRKKLRRGVDLIIVLNRMIRAAGLEDVAKRQRRRFREQLASIAAGGGSSIDYALVAEHAHTHRRRPSADAKRDVV